ncbi:peptidoglycan DD-metalloendopeptidase family protein [Pontibacter sp. JH31]|uniref:Peptidoglycan DD-metalloendopeptidase family protein n=1 Tax=Pontibacter aquaedesilientis TaxID=2766980 RepID=A0ABR7XHX0_9BACT|nr:peptidoglycan DD-metalloendopeptidase family protein [Pontibacter aquaedesilientis]MBD1397031.1 peptidoglycan DD-metalloendopeptidase family protein [Pontibacter aquaedesilientis]
MFKRSVGLAILIAVSLFVFLTAAQTISFKTESINNLEKEPDSAPEAVKEQPAPVIFGIPTDTLEIVGGTVERGENLSQILADFNISPTTIDLLARKSKDIYNVRRINAKRNYFILHARDSAQTARYFIYEPNEVEYVIYDLNGELDVRLEKREIEVVERAIAGFIQSSLFESILAAGGSPQLVNHFADIYAWRLNLSRLQPGDSFKLIYDEKMVNGNTIGFGKIKAAYFEHEGKPLYAIAFDQGGKKNAYYDQDGKSLKKAFLREPLEYSRISSRFTMNRFHPVQKRYKPHLGTDFAAPRGTPIRTVGEGVVVEAAYTRGNGYYVKIKHNKTYTTQYLHMSKFAKGIRKGRHVVQGQTIGYVGSTGLATGPHLCYRFWKNGRQVDALKVKLPSAHPIDKKHMAAFEQLKAEIEGKMLAIELKNIQPKELLAADKPGKASGEEGA